MGFLRELFNSIKTKSDPDRAFLHTQNSSDGISARGSVRKALLDDIFLLERALLMDPKQLAEVDFTRQDEQARAPFDELEFIVKTGLSPARYISNAKECVSDLYYISETKVEEPENFYGDDLSESVLGLLHRQAAQVLLLSGDDENGRISWLVKQPRSFVQATLIEEGKKADVFDDVKYDEDLSSLDMDYNEYIHKFSYGSGENVVYAADKAFNKQALRQKKLIDKWEKKLRSAKGEYRSECEYRKMRAEKNLARGIETRRDALTDAFRTGVIGEYYFRQRSEQLNSGDFSGLPGFFEADDLKNEAAYLKKHDLQDLSRAEADSIILLAKKKADEDKRVFFTKKFLVAKGLASAKRFTISEMKIDPGLLYRGFSAGGGFSEGLPKESEEAPTRVTIDVGDTTAKREDPVPFDVRYIEPLDRRVDK